MRDEFIKFERYQKQFHFLIDNDIETTGQLNDIKQNAEDKIAELTLKRTRLYSKLDSEDEIYDINIELKKLRANLRMCNNILEDAERIQIGYNRALELEEEAERQNRYRNRNQISRQSCLYSKKYSRNLINFLNHIDFYAYLTYNNRHKSCLEDYMTSSDRILKAAEANGGTITTEQVNKMKIHRTILRNMVD